MSLADDLLEQARHLANRERRRPKQASLRRAVSAAYYAMFHLLVDDASRMLMSDVGPRRMISRSFLHSEMKEASKAFAGGTLPARFDSIPHGAIQAPLRKIESTFLSLQDARHEADYNIARTFTRRETKGIVDSVESAFAVWQVIRKDPAARLYLVSLLFWDRFKRSS